MEASTRRSPWPRWTSSDPRPARRRATPTPRTWRRYGAPVPPPVSPFAHPVAQPAPVQRRGPRLFAAGDGPDAWSQRPQGSASHWAARPRHAAQRRRTAERLHRSGPERAGVGGTPFGGTPFTGPGGSGGTPFDSSSGGTPASDSQLTGLVRIAPTLKYQRRPGGRHRNDPHQHRRGGHQPPRRRGRHQDPRHRDEHRQRLPARRSSAPTPRTTSPCSS